MILRSLALMAPCRAADGEGSGGGGGEDAPNVVPVEALQAERKARQELEVRLAKIEGDRKAAEEAAATKAGEYQKLYEPTKAERDALKAENEAFKAAETARSEKLQARNETRIKALPEASQKAIKALVGKLSPEDVADYLDEHGSTFGAEATRPAGTVSNGGRKTEDAIPPEALVEWERHGKRLGQTDREYYENVYKPRIARRNRK
jgi:hypothetical protein